MGNWRVDNLECAKNRLKDQIEAEKTSAKDDDDDSDDDDVDEFMDTDGIESISQSMPEAVGQTSDGKNMHTLDQMLNMVSAKGKPSAASVKARAKSGKVLSASLKKNSGGKKPPKTYASAEEGSAGIA